VDFHPFLLFLLLLVALLRYHWSSHGQAIEMSIVVEKCLNFLRKDSTGELPRATAGDLAGHFALGQKALSRPRACVNDEMKQGITI
jgi:hypothetical protein